MSAPIVLGVVAVVVIVVGSIIFNRLVRLRNLTRESWRDVDAELQRRYDLIPNLVNTVKGYAAYERSTLDAVTAVRAEAMAVDARARRAGRPGTGPRARGGASPRGGRAVSGAARESSSS